MTTAFFGLAAAGGGWSAVVTPGIEPGQGPPRKRQT
jgi:hypothetical protein